MAVNRVQHGFLCNNDEFNIPFCILTFAKTECDNVLQPLLFGLQHIITLGLGKR